MRYLALACDYDGTLAAEGRVPPETVGALERLRAQNLVLFLQLSAGVDDVTWLYHRRQGDYSRWFHADL